MYRVNIECASLLLRHLIVSSCDNNDDNDDNFNYFRTVAHSAVLGYKGFFIYSTN